MADPKAVICFVGCGICILLIVLIILLVSIGTVEPVEYAITYNSVSKKADEHPVYVGGWYLIGPFTSFLTFPATLVNTDFADYTRSKDDRAPLQKVKDNGGQDITLSFAFQFELQKENVGELYKNFKTEYRGQFNTWAESEVRKVVGSFSNTMFWTDRAEAAEKMRDAIDKKFLAEKNYARCKNLQIINVQLSAKREQSLIDTQVTTQEGKTKLKEQTAKSIRSEISVFASDAQKAVTGIKGNASAQAKIIVANATSNATNTVITATSKAYLALNDKVGINPSQNLDQFLYYTNLQTQDGPNILYNINKAFIRP